jgi:hypothetical protein
MQKEKRERKQVKYPFVPHESFELLVDAFTILVVAYNIPLGSICGVTSSSSIPKHRLF